MSGIIELRQRIRGVRLLDEVVHAMRSIAGVRLRQAQRAFAGLAAYEGAIAEALGMALAWWPEAGRALAERAAGGPRALVLIGSEHGFVGAYNDHLVAAAGRNLAAGDRLVVVGARAARLARRHGLAVAARHPMPARVDHASAAALGLAEAVWPDYRAGTVARIALLHSHAPAGEAPTPACVPLAPLAMAAAPTALRQPPLSHLPPAELVGRIAGELLVARLIRGLVEALEAENLLRMRAMERAQRNVQRRLEELRLAECRLAQELTTNEILELVNAGA